MDVFPVVESRHEFVVEDHVGDEVSFSTDIVRLDPTGFSSTYGRRYIHITDCSLNIL